MTKHQKLCSTPNVVLLFATTLCLGLATSACAPNNSNRSTTPAVSNQNESPQATQASSGGQQNVVRVV
ncbi:MAG: hypothetical protein F6K28_41100 [Microcoleus sp. SIO2G3]|nr:hypothetical protein [Microcoleus sp. SIO2G3]